MSIVRYGRDMPINKKPEADTQKRIEEIATRTNGRGGVVVI
jgi:hypothetical protein